MPPLRTNPLYSLKYKVAGGAADFVCCGTPLLLSAAQFAGNRGRRGLLFTAQFAAVGLLSAAQFGGCYSRHSLVLRRGGCYSRHNSKPLLFTAHFRFLRKKSGCYRRHNCVWGCYSRHNSAGLLNTAQLPSDSLLNLALYRLFFCVGLLNTAHFRVLLSAAHFPCFAVVIGGTFRFWVVIHGTIPKTLLFTAQLEKSGVVIRSTVCAEGC